MTAWLFSEVLWRLLPFLECSKSPIFLPPVCLSVTASFPINQIVFMSSDGRLQRKELFVFIQPSPSSSCCIVCALRWMSNGYWTIRKMDRQTLASLRASPSGGIAHKSVTRVKVADPYRILRVQSRQKIKKKCKSQEKNFYQPLCQWNPGDKNMRGIEGSCPYWKIPSEMSGICFCYVFVWCVCVCAHTYYI